MLCCVVGMVGALGEFGNKEENVEEIKKGEWTRLVITSGGAWGSRKLCTYKNALRCSTIEKSLLNTRDGRFGLAPEGLVMFANTDDIFVHMEVLRAYGMAELVQGEAICVRVAQGPRGRMAVEVRAWDFAAGS